MKMANLNSPVLFGRPASLYRHTRAEKERQNETPVGEREIKSEQGRKNQGRIRNKYISKTILLIILDWREFGTGHVRYAVSLFPLAGKSGREKESRRRVVGKIGEDQIMFFKSQIGKGSDPQSSRHFLNLPHLRRFETCLLGNICNNF